MMEKAMKKSILPVAVAMTTAFYTISAVSADVASLRGDELTTMSAEPAKTKVMSVTGGIIRSYKEQPPMVPHTVDKYEINLKNNGCMKCHSEKTYKKEKAPKVGDSHYVTRDGKVLDTISSRRYFCNQCHATQEDARPLVKNNFAGTR
jgi:cytochrome c-type protein NapB